MNIFVLHEKPDIAAKLLYDKHIAKMAIEAVQMLSAGIRLQLGRQGEMLLWRTGRQEKYKFCLEAELGSEQIIYLLSHHNHPCSVWARSSKANFLWLYEHALTICRIQAARNGKQPKTMDTLMKCLEYLPFLDFKHTGLTPFANATGLSLNPGETVVDMYRRYYSTVKQRLAIYGKRQMSLDERIREVLGETDDQAC